MRALPPPATVDPETALVPDIEPSGRPTTPHLSYSQLGMYLRCSKQYWYRYVLGLKDPPNVSMLIGSGGHAALEWNTKTKIRTGLDAPVEAVIQKASDMMDFHMSRLPASEIVHDAEPGGLKDKFINATKVFRVRDAPALRPLGAEVEFNLDMNQFQDANAEPLPEPIRIVNGKIDLVYDDYTTLLAGPTTGRVGIDDFKYAGRKKSQAEVDLSPQLTLYAGWFKTATGKWPSKLALRQMHPGTKQDGPDALHLLRDPLLMTGAALTRRLQRLAYQFRMAEKGIREGVFIPVDNPITCSWCGFRTRCQDSLVSDYEAATIRATTSPLN